VRGCSRAAPSTWVTALRCCRRRRSRPPTKQGTGRAPNLADATFLD
jgi:hypothetical protein